MTTLSLLTATTTASSSSVSTVAGSRAGGAAGKGFADGEAAAARFNHPHAVAVDGNNTILVADHSNQRLRKIAGEGALVTTLAGSSMGALDGEGAIALFTCPQAMAIDERGRLLVADSDNSLRMVEAALVPRLAVAFHWRTMPSCSRTQRWPT